ncbi:hypothetical protein RG47T_3720 [Mucilaginibacter polytrichastri]|uniref:Uncharacterized protein n=1 Tax=Mucilaginibacter polytrichastri TaxID=1302689 RepID=A0A1Q6A2K8_9SPHI|nr:hypothetical protein RG47T_3720 [Mucilaginibacter polytrichastri]
MEGVCYAYGKAALINNTPLIPLERGNEIIASSPLYRKIRQTN